MSQDVVLTIPEVAAELRCSKAHVYKRQGQGSCEPACHCHGQAQAGSPKYPGSLKCAK